MNNTTTTKDKEERGTGVKLIPTSKSLTPSRYKPDKNYNPWLEIAEGMSKAMYQMSRGSK